MSPTLDLIYFWKTLEKIKSSFFPVQKNQNKTGEHFLISKLLIGLIVILRNPKNGSNRL